MTDKAIRPWCARMQYDGKKPFLLGTFFCSNGAQQNEIDDGLWELVDWLFPARPKLLELLPGSIFFVPEKDRTVGPADKILEKRRNEK